MTIKFGWKLALSKEMLNRTVENNSKEEMGELNHKNVNSITGNHKNVNSMTTGIMSVLFTVIASDVCKYLVLKDTKILIA